MTDAATLALDRRLSRVLDANRRGRDARREPRNTLAWLPVLQRWQAQRLEKSFIDFLAQARTEPAARFFLDDLYGDYDVTRRDHDVERVLPLMRKLLPVHLIETAADAIELAWLSHAFDLRMAEQLQRLQPRVGKLDVNLYGNAYRAAGKPRLREHQIVLVLRVGRTLDEAVHKPWIPRLLRASRLPAKIAGLGTLQAFLERGFAAFTQLCGADEFLDAIAARERRAARNLLAARDDPFGFDALR